MSGGEGERRERTGGVVLALALLVALAALWSAQAEPFAFPNNDFYSFRRAALSVGAGELPHSLKRGPILPAVMAALAPAFPGRHALLHAALAANLAFSLAMLAALVAFARRLWPDAAPLFAALLATAPVFHAMALQPLVEPSLGCFVALAFLGLAARSPWQYAAAGAAALSRPDAVALLGVLALANAAAERRPLRHLALAALGALPCALWYGLGALRGTGAATYLSLRHAFGGASLGFLAGLPREVFAGWWGGRSPAALGAFALAVGAPGALGAVTALRTAPRETAAMALWLALSTAVVVLYGVGKPRYAHATLFVPLLFFAIGVAELAGRTARALARRESLATALAVLAGAATLALLARAGLRLLGEELLVAPRAELAFAALAAGLVLAACVALARPGPRAAVAAGALVAFALAAPVALGGLARKAELLRAVHDFDYAAWPASQWLGAHLGPGERVVLLHRAQVIWATGLPGDRVLSFSAFEASDLASLRDEMRRRGVTHAVYTWRRPATTDAERFYDRRRKVDLAALFASGGPVEGFEHVAALPAPARLGQPPAQVYRLAANGPVLNSEEP